jgi:ammonium transporter Rh
MIFWGLNEAIGVTKIQATDMGGSIFVHTFGAYYGLAASYFFQPNRAKKSKNCESNYHSEMIALVGSIFLWMYWPSFNGALASGATQHRTFINTVLGISGSVIGGVCVSRILFGKLEMEIMLNATLAGGVAIGSAADLVTAPWASLLIGFLGGVLSSVGF